MTNSKIPTAKSSRTHAKKLNFTENLGNTLTKNKLNSPKLKDISIV